jgi:8-oxo-dGTP pyrophosphatase MutT (NUDIX family)
VGDANSAPFPWVETVTRRGPRLGPMAQDSASPPRRQRVGAYAVMWRRENGADQEILLTRMAPGTRLADRWTLPGGGIQHGEEPRDALRREVHEETGLHVEPSRVLDVHSIHFVGARSDGLIEDYHGIHLLFAVRLLPESEGVEPEVVEVGGSTDLAMWVPRRKALGLDLLSAARYVLTEMEPPP